MYARSQMVRKRTLRGSQIYICRVRLRTIHAAIYIIGTNLWLCLYSFNPSSDLRKIIQRKSAFVGDVRVGEKRDVGDAVIANKEFVPRQMLIHNLQSRPAAIASGGESFVLFR